VNRTTCDSVRINSLPLSDIRHALNRQHNCVPGSVALKSGHSPSCPKIKSRYRQRACQSTVQMAIIAVVFIFTASSFHVV